MTCKYPLCALKTPRSDGSGKSDISFLPVTKREQYKDDPRYVEIPCGQCSHCRLNKAAEWADRICLEAQSYKDNYFVTLTYDDDNLVYGIDPQTGEVSSNATVFKSHVSSFMKDLRSYFSYHFAHVGVRFYAAAEYGSLSYRPHYHLILFNCPISDLKPFFKNQLGDWIYQSDTISKIWKKGNCTVGALTWESAAYTARYTLKKKTGKEKDLYRILGVNPEFSLMSNRPGIGRRYLDKNMMKVYNDDKIYLSTARGGKILRPSRYYDRIFDQVSPTKMAEVKEKRRFKVTCRVVFERTLTDLSDQEYRDLKLRSEDARLEKLPRRGIK